MTRSNAFPLAFAFLLLAGCSGLDGAKGDPGGQGDPGDKGSNGADGSSCTVKDNGDGTQTIECGDGTEVTFASGTDGKDGVNGQDGDQGLQGLQGVQGIQGVQGLQGEQGLTGDQGDKGDQGIQGIQGLPGDKGDQGDPGDPGTPGTTCKVADLGNGTKEITCTDGSKVTVTDGGNVVVTNFHGRDYLETTGEFANGAKERVTATITSATADINGTVVVNFSVARKNGDPIKTVASVRGVIAQLIPGIPNVRPAGHWAPYFVNTVTAGGAACNTTGAKEWNCPPYNTAPTASAKQPGSESSGTGASNGTLTNNENGTYTYTFKRQLGTIPDLTDPSGVATIPYDNAARSRTHRITITMGGHSGPTADANFDFVPNGSPVAVTRDIINTGTCKQCHGEEFHGHGGDRLTAESCQSCHVAGTTDPQSGASLEFKRMIHQIHGGGELKEAAGTDGILWNDPLTVTDESADNKNVIWGYGGSAHRYWKVGFPAVHGNCTKCHDGTGGAQKDNWKTVPSAEACTSCHDDISVVTSPEPGVGLEHPADAHTNAECAVCHKPDATGGVFIAAAVSSAHDFSTTDPTNTFAYDARNQPEFLVELYFTNMPTAGYYTANDPAPILEVVLRDNEDPAHPVINLTTMTSEANSASAEGCAKASCPNARDNVFARGSVYVAGPRDLRMPALVTGARAQVVGVAGPYNLSAAGLALSLTVDGGGDIIAFENGADVVRSGRFTGISLARTSTGACAWADATSVAVTAAEVAACLNGNAGFQARATAIDQSGALVLRSRNRGSVHSIQLVAGAATTALFGAASTVTNVVLGGGGADIRSDKVNPQITSRTGGAHGGLLMQLDAVGDLPPGTYLATVEIADRGSIDNNNYKTPSVVKLPFQIGTATVELPPAGNCDQCHQNLSGEGLVFDEIRHNKIFDQTSIDQCGACHDYQPSGVTGSSWGGGGKPISKRIHAVHNGNNLNYPVLTVDHADEPANRFWDIGFPQDIRNCETCHEDGTTSGSWVTDSARLPCMGCHDSDSAMAHMRTMTFDPTPADQWNGDEQESCTNCH